MIEPDSNLVLFVDETILAVNKPADVSVIHDSLRPDETTLVDQMKAGYGPLWVVHRLDRDTSGVIIFARTKAAHRILNNHFQSRQVKKIYHLIACGDFGWHEIEVELPLEVDGDRQHRTVINPISGKPANTFFKILQFFPHSLTLIRAEPKTGYTHQIRAHITALNGMIINDRLYKPHPYSSSVLIFNSSFAESWAGQHLPIHRLALHAESISFLHPAGGDPLTISAPYPDDFRESLAILKSTGQA